LDPFLRSVYSLNIIPYLVVIILFIGIYLKLNEQKVKRDIDIIPVLSITLLIISFLNWESFYNVSTYLGIPIAYLVYIHIRKELKIVLKSFLFINLIICLNEFLSNSYLFDSVIIDQFRNSSTLLDTKFSGGLTGVIRAKGLCFGPTTLGLFCISMSLLNRDNLIILISCIAASFLANSRLAIIVVTILLLIHLFDKFRLNKIWVLTIVSLNVILISIINKSSSDNIEISKSRIFQTFDISTSNNESRIEFWDKAFNMYMDYNIVEKLIGNNGFYKKKYYNNPESGWLSIFLDVGFFGFLLYFIPLGLILFYQYKTKSYIDMLSIFLVITVMLVVTFHLSALNNFMYWFLVFTFLENEKIKYQYYSSIKKLMIKNVYA